MERISLSVAVKLNGEWNKQELEMNNWTITVSCDSSECWKLIRTYEDFLELNSEFQTISLSLPPFPLPVPNWKEDLDNALEIYLNGALNSTDGEDGQIVIHKFIDDEQPCSSMQHTRLNIIAAQICHIDEVSQRHYEKARTIVRKYSGLLRTLNSLVEEESLAAAKMEPEDETKECNENNLYQQMLLELTPSQGEMQYPYVGAHGGAHNQSMMSLLSDFDHQQIQRLGSGDVDLGDDDDDDEDIRLDQSFEKIDDSTPLGSFVGLTEHQRSYFREEMADEVEEKVEEFKPLFGSKEASESHKLSYFVRWDSHDGAGDEADKGVDGKVLTGSGDKLERQAIDRDDLPSSKYLSSKLFPSTSFVEQYASAVEEVMHLLQPSAAQHATIASVLNMLKKEVRVANNSNIFESGFHRLQCFLPEDVLKVTVIARCNSLTSVETRRWHLNLIDHLQLVAMIGSSDMLTDSSEVVEQVNSLFCDYAPPSMHHVLCDVKSHQPNRRLIRCMVDALEVEINSNARNSLCMLAFLEEFAGLVGQDNLYKRSLLLIRAWWVYETASYVGSSIKNYLSDFSLCIMVCAIFNQYHSQINSPLQALCLFLTEYSGYDGATHAITLQGLVKFRGGTVNLLPLHAVRSTHLVSVALMDKYTKLFSVGKPVELAEERMNKLKTASSEDTAVDNYEAHAILNAASSDSINLMGHSSDSSADDQVKFVRSVFNILHPFEHTNMADETQQPAKKMNLVLKALQIGAVNLSVILKAMQESADLSAAQSLLVNYFPVIVSKFGPGNPSARDGEDTKSDVVAGSVPVSAEHLWHNISYCNFVLEKVLSEAALLTLTVEVLAETGPLTAPELLARLVKETGFPELGAEVEKKFGSLRALLSANTELFLDLHDSEDNSHFMFKRALTSEELTEGGEKEETAEEKLARLRKVPVVVPPSAVYTKKSSDKVLSATSLKTITPAFLAPSTQFDESLELPSHNNLLSRLPPGISAAQGQADIAYLLSGTKNLNPAILSAVAQLNPGGPLPPILQNQLHTAQQDGDSPAGPSPYATIVPNQLQGRPQDGYQQDQGGVRKTFSLEQRSPNERGIQLAPPPHQQNKQQQQQQQHSAFYNSSFSRSHDSNDFVHASAQQNHHQTAPYQLPYGRAQHQQQYSSHGPQQPAVGHYQEYQGHHHQQHPQQFSQSQYRPQPLQQQQFHQQQFGQQPHTFSSHPLTQQQQQQQYFAAPSSGSNQRPPLQPQQQQNRGPPQQRY